MVAQFVTLWPFFNRSHQEICAPAVPRMHTVGFHASCHSMQCVPLYLSPPIPAQNYKGLLSGIVRDRSMGRGSEARGCCHTFTGAYRRQGAQVDAIGTLA